MSMSLALFICALFISLMQSVNGAQILIILFFLLLGVPAVIVYETVIVPLGTLKF